MIQPVVISGQLLIDIHPGFFTRVRQSGDLPQIVAATKLLLRAFIDLFKETIRTDKSPRFVAL